MDRYDTSRQKSFSPGPPKKSISAIESTFRVHVTNITIVLDLCNSHPPVRSTEAFRLLSQGVTAVVHGCSVCALDHSMGKSRAFKNGPPSMRTAERKEIHQTSCLSTLLYTSQMLQVGPLLLEGGVQQSWLFSFVHSKLILLETTKTKSNSKTLQ